MSRRMVIVKLNNLVLYKIPEENIFTDRLNEYKIYMNTISTIITILGYEIIDMDYLNFDPTNPTYAWKYKLKNLETDESVDLIIPDIDKTLKFTIQSNTWIPVFQICDKPYFKRKDLIIICNMFGILFIDENFQYLKIKDDMWPIILLLLTIDGVETVADILNIDYEISDTKAGECSIKLCNNIYMNVLSYPDEHVENIFKPLSLNNFKVFENRMSKYDTIEEGLKNILKEWCDNNYILKIITASSLKDIIMTNNTLSSPYNRLVDIIYYIINNQIVIDELEMNDINNKRVRLSEWLLHKISSQYKYNLLNNDTVKIYSNILIDVLNVDQRRILDDSLNPLTELSNLTKIIYTGMGGISKEACAPSLRNLHESYFGKISAMDSPSGAAIGVSQNIVPTARLINGVLYSNDEVK